MADDRTRAWFIVVVLALVSTAVIADILSTDYNLPSYFYLPTGGAAGYAIKRAVDFR